MGSVVHHQVEHHPDAAAVGFSNKAVKICKSAEAGIDIAVIGNVVTEVVFGTFKKGAEPDGIDAQRARRAVIEIVKLLDDAGQVADPVAVAVLEAAGVNLVKYGFFPPIYTG